MVLFHVLDERLESMNRGCYKMTNAHLLTMVCRVYLDIVVWYVQVVL